MTVLVVLTAISAVMLIANLLILSLVVKLYTEWFKERAMSSRGKGN